MASAFTFASAFNGDISGWNVSKVTNMNTMFGEATTFNQDISGWNVSNVTNMTLMFDHATSFNQDISGWRVSKLISCSLIFLRSGMDANNLAAINNTDTGWLRLQANGGLPADSACRTTISGL